MKGEPPSFHLLAALAFLLALGGALSLPVQAAFTGTIPVSGVVHLVAYNVTVWAVQDTGANITWSTNTLANGTVEYGRTTSYGSVRTEPGLVVNRTLSLDGLTPGTTYHYRIVSVDAYGHVYRSGDLQFTTTGTPPGPSGGGSGGGGGGSWGPSRLIQAGGCRAAYAGVVTPVTEPGTLTSCTIISTVNGMADLRSSWSVTILGEPPEGARFITYILSQPSESTMSAFDASLRNAGFGIIALAYVMEVVQSPHVPQENAIILMDVNRTWVRLNGGVDAVRILRQGEDGAVRILDTKFSNYVLDTGHMNFRASSPDDLALYALVTVEAAALPSTTAPAETATTVEPTGTATEPGRLPAPASTGFLALVVILTITGLAIGLLLHTRRLRR